MITLTPNRRLAATLSKQFQQEQLAAQQKCWHTPLILPFSSWLEKLWHEYTIKKIATHPRLLTPAQTLIVFEEIIADSRESLHLIQRSETAELAKSAWGLLKQYNLALTHPKLDSTEDSTVFLSWAKAFQTYCDKNNCLDQHALTDLLTKKIADYEIGVTDSITLYGFTEISPQQQRLLSYAEKQGATITHQHTDMMAEVIERTEFPDTETEIRTMAQAAKIYYDQNPTAKIGCVVPNLEDKREMMLRIFSEVLTPTGFYTARSLTLPFNISAGKNLASYPVIRTALTLLSLQHATLTLEKFSSLLHSPFLGEAEQETFQRANFSDQLYRANMATLSLKNILALHAEPNLNTSCPKLAARFKLLLEKTPPSSQTHTMSEWVDHFVTWLTLLGWPGERSTNSEEHQTIKRWLELLNQFKQLDSLLPPQPKDIALRYLHQITKNDVFQPESPETPIQILGMLEAAELRFDYLWVMGLDDTTWPPTPAPNPFVPLHLQKNLNMPHASHNRELQFCEAITEQLKKSANTIIFSSALQNDTTELRPSALIENIPVSEINVLFTPDKNTRPAHFIFAHQQIEKIIDTLATPITQPEKIAGGVKIFELQAACPFKAFAEIRLRAKPTESLTLGLRAMDKGIIIHEILEIFWQAVKNSKTLKNQSDDATQSLIKKSIATALKKYAKQQPDNKRYLALEAIRLQSLISEWIEMEKLRPDFSVIAFEQTCSITIGKIPVTVRIDRIDEIAQYGKLIIDYKTGKDIDIKNCFGDRLDASQLPLYCLIDPDQTIGIAYAKIHPEKMQLTGVSQFNLEIANIKAIAEVSYTDATVWSEQLQQWEKNLTTLSQHFCAGQAAPDPKDAINTCKHCQLKPFCRIHETDDHSLAVN